MAGVLLLSTGGLLGWQAFHTPPEHTPDVATTLVAPASQKPVGPTKAATGMEPKKMAPNHLFIPAVNVYAEIAEDGATGTVVEGELKLPPPSQVTRNVRGATVGSTTGALLLAGHVKWNDEKGALYNLATVPLGSQAFVTDARGNRQGFWLKSLEPIKKTSLPKSVWETTGPERLVTVTCGGELVKRGSSWVFESNIVGTWLPLEVKGAAPTSPPATPAPR